MLVTWLQIELYTDSETFKLMGKEHALVICNHRSDIDWLVGWVLAQRAGCLGSTLAVMKKSSKFLPVIGWSMWFSEYLFLERSWAKDEITLKSGLHRLRDFPQPFWLALFVEGTRFTQAKLLAAQEYASSMGLPVPRNVLIPRTKGFVTAVSHLRSFVPAIYDITLAIPETSPAPTLLRLFKGQSSVLHVHVKRHLMNDLPESDDDVAQWCKDAFVAKDELLDKHTVVKSFGEQFQDIGRPVKSLLVNYFSQSFPLNWTSSLLSNSYETVFRITGRHFLGNLARLGCLEDYAMLFTSLFMERHHLFSHCFSSCHNTYANLDSVLTVGAINPAQSRAFDWPKFFRD
ncbi:hypothetical protein ACS0TY_025025 [Phlomoides rotata]